MVKKVCVIIHSHVHIDYILVVLPAPEGYPGLLKPP